MEHKGRYGRVSFATKDSANLQIAYCRYVTNIEKDATEDNVVGNSVVNLWGNGCGDEESSDTEVVESCG